MKIFFRGHSLWGKGLTLMGAIVACLFTVFHAPQAARRQDAASATQFVTAGENQGYILREENGQRVCRDAAPAELLRPLADAQRDMRVIYEGRAGTGTGLQQLSQQAGLRITLRATSQLESNQQAKDAFIRAAQNWESQIVSPISIVIDVDFGTTFFGEAYDSPNVIGQASSQILGSRTGYPNFRAALIAGASSAAESALYNNLPAGQLPSDQGDITGVFASSSVLRAIGFIGPNADPDAEQQQFGAPPRIGFNSATPFDFDPSDGVASNRIDFDGTATHEIGHVLGFSSLVGDKELNPSATARVSLLDFFRFRPGVTLGSVSTAPRVLASGGAQVFFGGGPELGLSTGRPDGTGGDNNQASHWKANELTGVYLGVMDPTASRGEREQITQNDLAAFDTIGYRLGSGGASLTAVSAASFRGAELAADSIASVFGQNLATGTASATSASLPTTLAGASVRVRDSAGAERLAPLFFASPGQLNFLFPTGTALGVAEISAGATAIGSINIVGVSPGLFSASGNGQGVAAAVALRVRANGSQSFESVATPIDLGPAGDQVFLIMFGTGIRGLSSLGAVSARVGGVNASVTFAGAQGGLFGLDQVNVLLPRSLQGRNATVSIALTVDGKIANPVEINVQ